MGWSRLGTAGVGALVVAAMVGCGPTPWEAELVSVNAAGSGPGDGYAGPPVWSADGSAVAFASTSTDLVRGDPDDDADVFVRDLDAGLTTLASPHPTAGTNTVTVVDALSADGTKVLFHSDREDLTDLPDANGGDDYFLRDLVAGTTTVVSVNASGTATGNADSAPRHAAFMTDDGTRVAFTSFASDLVAGGSDIGDIALFVRNMTTGTTTLVAEDTGEPQGFSADGSRVLFPTLDPLVPQDANGDDDLYLRDLAAGTTTLVSVDATGTAAGDRGTWIGTLTPDGEQVLFTSLPSNLAAGVVDTNGRNDVFLRDLAGGTTRLVSTDATGTAAAAADSTDGVLSPDGSTVVYKLDATGGWPSDPDKMDLYTKDLVTGAVTKISPRTNASAGGAGTLYPVGFTTDGRSVVFVTDAGNLGPVDDNGSTDVYARDLVSATTNVVSATPDRKKAGGGSAAAVRSPAGDQVAFLAPAAGRANVFVATLRPPDGG